MCPAEAPMATVPSAAAKPSWTISQPESVPPGCSGKFLLRSRAVHRADLPLCFFSRQINVQFRAGTALSAHRIPVLAGHDVIPVGEVAVGQSPGDALATWWELDDISTEPVNPDEFRVHVPPGTRTVEETGNPFADAAAVMPGVKGTAARAAAEAVNRTAGAVSAARSFLDDLRGHR